MFKRKRYLGLFMFVFFLLIVLFGTNVLSQSKVLNFNTISKGNSGGEIENEFTVENLLNNQAKSLTEYYSSRSEEIVYLSPDDPIIDDFKYEQLVFDRDLYNYLGITQIHKGLIDGITGYNNLYDDPVTIVVFDNLVDFNHANLKRMVITGDPGNEVVQWLPAVHKVVLLNDEYGVAPSERYREFDIDDLDPYDEEHQYFTKFTLYDYIHEDYYSHGTSVAGIINQIAPGARIISVAYPSENNDMDVFYEILKNFFYWLQTRGSIHDVRVVNLSNRWGDKQFGELTQNQKDDLETIILSLINPASNNGMVFTASAGNDETGEDQINLVYPSHLSNNWEDDPFYNDFQNAVVINGKYDYKSNPAIATGFMSVGSIHDSEYPLNTIGLRSDVYVYDEDKTDNSTDLKIMAPGFEIRTTANTRNETTNEYISNSQANFTGTSAAAPCAAGIAALLLSADSSLKAYEIEKMISENALYDSNVELTGDELMQKYGLGMLNPIGTLAQYDNSLSNLDTDGDTVIDVDELYIYHTNVTDTDSDDDTLPDGGETEYGTNPLVDDAGIDYDNDALTNTEEYNHGTDPLDDDTDNDWLLDGEEINTYLTDPLDGDSDDDYLPDGWEVASGYDPNSPDNVNNDNDGDGLTALDELAYGTLDNNNDTDGDFISDGDEIHFTMTDPLDEDTDNDGVIDSEEDPDNDGATNLMECQANTNPYLQDTDGDGLSDGWEIDNGLNPLVNDSAGDPDNDNAPNSEEYSHGTDPQDSDSDNDGMPDGWEITYNLNPLSDDSTADPDGDTLYNIDEYTSGADPTDTDTDNDGLNDKQEFLHNSDPTDTDTDNDGWNDYYEVYTSGTEPDDADTDNDGISDKTEYYWWVNTYGQSSSSAYSKIKDYDADNDGLSDGWEKSHGINPLDNDCDNDGLLDGLEVITYGTDPEDTDTDNDGYTDLYEVINGTDPNDPNDYPGGGWGW